jgi:DNA ligase-1
LSKIQYPAILQEKCDGVRCMLHVTNGMQVAYTRNGKVMQIPQFKGLLATENGYVIDGELLHYTDGVLDDRKTGNGKANSSLTTPSTSDGWVLVSWDFIPDVSFFSDDKCELTYTYRVSLLETATTNADNVILVTGCHDIVNNIDEANVKFQAYLDKGSEGAMLKNMDHLWVNKRSPDLVKMKAVLTADLKIIDVEEGTGKYQGMLGAILVTDETGNVSSYVGTGFSDTDRQQMWKHKESLIDMIVEVKYNEIITNKASTTKSLFLPVYIELRLDKNEVDSIK